MSSPWWREPRPGPQRPRALAGTTPGLRALMAVAGVDPGRSPSVAGFGSRPDQRRRSALSCRCRARALMTDEEARAQEIASDSTAATPSAGRSRCGSGSQPKPRSRLGGTGPPTCSRRGLACRRDRDRGLRLVESSGRPVVMIALDGDRGRGSGRTSTPSTSSRRSLHARSTSRDTEGTPPLRASR